MNNGRVNAERQRQEQDPQDTIIVVSAAKLQPHPPHRRRSPAVLAATYGSLFIGSVASSLLAKFYFVNRGSSRWVSTWVQSTGFPLLLIPIYLPYLLFPKRFTRRPFTRFTRRHLVLSVFIGLMLGFNNLLFSWGTSYLPVSTSSLLLSTQLIFTLILSVLIVKQRVTFSNLNCVVLLTLSSVLLALGSSSDKPPGLTRFNYFIGFISTIGAGLLFALYLPITEKLYGSVTCYAMVMEMQLVMEISATVLAMIGMVFDGGFKEMVKEANQGFTKGPVCYWWVAIGATVVTWQLCFAGTAGMVYLTSGITGGICMTALLAMNVIGGVVVYGDEFGGVKAVSTVLCVWGFCSYVYGIYTKTKEEEERSSLSSSPELEAEGRGVGDSSEKVAADDGGGGVEMGRVGVVAAAEERV